jgi:hypothetical protein
MTYGEAMRQMVEQEVIGRRLRFKSSGFGMVFVTIPAITLAHLLIALTRKITAKRSIVGKYLMSRSDGKISTADAFGKEGKSDLHMRICRLPEARASGSLEVAGSSPVGSAIIFSNLAPL